jgi:hypothetical protein
MSRVLLFLGLSIPGALWTQDAAAQNPLPVCPADDEAVTTTAPGYVRRGGSLAITAERGPDASVTSVTLTVSSGQGNTTETLAFGEEAELRIIRAVPPGRRTVLVRVAWIQGAGSPAACAGTDEYPAIPVIAASARAGNPAVARVSGRWSVRRGPGGRSSRARWRLKPRCDVFGCRTRLRSTGGFRGYLVPIRGGRYQFKIREKYATCQVTYIDGSQDNHGIYRYVTLLLRPTKVREGVARGMTGLYVARYEAPNDAAGVCNVPGKKRRTVTAARL